MFAKSDEVEATCALVKRADGWRIQFLFDDGTVTEQESPPPFKTEAEAQAALDAYIEQTGMRKVAIPQ
jgi:hypothetical protein